MLKKYSMSYENGKCAVGYEFVNGYYERGAWVDSYCRKIRKYHTDPYEKQKQKERQEERETQSRIFRTLLENKSPYSDTETDLSE
jgi:hypothetical protein